MGHSNIKLYGIGGEASDGKWAHRDQPHHFARVAVVVYEKKSLNVNLKLSSVARLHTGLPLRSSLSSSGMLALAACVGGVLVVRCRSTPLAPRRWRRPCGKDAATWAWAFNDSTIWYVYVHIHKSFGKHYDHLLCMTVVYSIIVLVVGCFWIGPRLPILFGFYYTINRYKRACIKYRDVC